MGWSVVEPGLRRWENDQPTEETSINVTVIIGMIRAVISVWLQWLSNCQFGNVLRGLSWVVIQLVRNVCETQRFITVFMWIGHWTLFSLNYIQLILTQQFILILSYYLRKGLRFFPDWNNGLHTRVACFSVWSNILYKILAHHELISLFTCV